LSLPEVAYVPSEALCKFGKSQSYWRETLHCHRYEAPSALAGGKFWKANPEVVNHGAGDEANSMQDSSSVTEK
jgi:hypothetical protein